MEEVVAELSSFATVSPLSSSKMMKFIIVNEIKVDIVNYTYDWIDNPVKEGEITLASIKDIAAMKLSAITNRGTKKDFIDFYVLLKFFSFDQLLDLYLQKYGDVQLFTTIKSLTYFDDAEGDPMPVMLESLKWDEVKSKIVDEVNTYLTQL